MRSSTAMRRRAEKNDAEKARRRSSSVRHVSGIEAGVARPDCGGKVDPPPENRRIITMFYYRTMRERQSGAMLSWCVMFVLFTFGPLSKIS